MQPRLERPHRRTGDLAHLVVTQSLFVEKEKYPLIFGPQSPHGLANFPLEFVAFVAANGRTIGNFFWKGAFDGPASTLAQPRTTAIGRDGENPRPKRPFRVPAIEMPQRADEGFLRGVFRFVPIPQDSQANAENQTLESLDKLAKRRVIPFETTLDEQPFVVQVNLFHLAVCGRF